MATLCVVSKTRGTVCELGSKELGRKGAGSKTDGADAGLLRMSSQPCTKPISGRLHVYVCMCTCAGVVPCRSTRSATSVLPCVHDAPGAADATHRDATSCCRADELIESEHIHGLATFAHHGVKWACANEEGRHYKWARASHANRPPATAPTTPNQTTYLEAHGRAAPLPFTHLPSHIPLHHTLAYHTLALSHAYLSHAYLSHTQLSRAYL